MTHALHQHCLNHLHREEESVVGLSRAVAAVRHAWTQGDPNAIVECLGRLEQAVQHADEVRSHRQSLSLLLGQPISSLTDLSQKVPAQQAAQVQAIKERLETLAWQVREDLRHLHTILSFNRAWLQSFMEIWLGNGVERYGPSGERLTAREKVS
jgi:hypothetical protein